MNSTAYERLKKRDEKKTGEKGRRDRERWRAPAEPLADVKLNDTIIYPSQ